MKSEEIEALRLRIQRLISDVRRKGGLHGYALKRGTIAHKLDDIDSELFQHWCDAYSAEERSKKRQSA